MSLIWTRDGSYRRDVYDGEADLEKSIVLVQSALFGPHRIYLPVKRRIGANGGVRNIPDGYLIDLSGPTPKLFVVENELADHDLLRHIAVQILQFSLSFETEGRGVKAILFEALQQRPALLKQCEQYVSGRGFRNLDHLLEAMVFEAPFAALVIIDELPDHLEVVLGERFQFGVEVIELARYRNDAGEHMYLFEPFLQDVLQDVAPTETEQVDTVVVPAREEGIATPFLAENRWYAIRSHGTMRPQIKHLALYQVAPVSAMSPKSGPSSRGKTPASMSSTSQHRRNRSGQSHW